ncbi:hypothetical protein [Fischerella thermalis]|jgi:hypothetical protein|uniref:Uncharacterized protein n=1 Tax=Fischerella thermalis JSC-11 TaxID=741277 RepID=G6FQ30_9CYAN|nr:hypothetical protein [Fischerella thermalis]PLZ75848.1 hypothetical protein CBP16_23660 [Fischerella thermalis WC217]EHC17915.1 hypothetical protein FJSC11DRAFT_0977 [Fischerella thermalis JSC-11]PLZ06611.1 hypothetical protein CBP19_19695 [Fischerella thermalis WC1110]PLZ15587.1 hypothetical protein CBP18_00575 [Fischerella thermalis WC119]PLZ15782.1 hypothetical protein CBP17_01195 [Fischerella thermalis WC114]
MTAQVCERINFYGEIIPMSFCIPLPEQNPVMKLNEQDINIGNDHPLVFSTAYWRLPIGTWKINKGQLYLVDIFGLYKMLGKTPTRAKWFSGVIKIPQGKLLHHRGVGFGSLYEQEIYVKIKKGKVIHSGVIDNPRLPYNSPTESENLYDDGDNGW